MNSMERRELGKYIVADPKICHGTPTFKGTRLLVSDVLDMVADGMDWDAIIRQCHNRITREAIAEALTVAGLAFQDHASEYLREPVTA